MEKGVIHTKEAEIIQEAFEGDGEEIWVETDNVETILNQIIVLEQIYFQIYICLQLYSQMKVRVGSHLSLIC